MGWLNLRVVEWRCLESTQTVFNFVICLGPVFLHVLDQLLNVLQDLLLPIDHLIRLQSLLSLKLDAHFFYHFLSLVSLADHWLLEIMVSMLLVHICLGCVRRLNYVNIPCLIERLVQGNREDKVCVNLRPLLQCESLSLVHNTRIRIRNDRNEQVQKDNLGDDGGAYEVYPEQVARVQRRLFVMIRVNLKYFELAEHE